jgi:hypothetical protein
MERRLPNTPARSSRFCILTYFRAPRWGFFNFDWRIFRALRFGLLMMKVPLP